MFEGLVALVTEGIKALPLQYQTLVSVTGLALLITIYALISWKFYRFIARKDIIKLNLARYNQSDHPVGSKLLATLLYFLEYIIILPFLIFFWFAVFAGFLFLLVEESSAHTVISLSAAIIASIRMLAYYKQDVAEEIAKLFPITVLVVFITNAKFTSLTKVLEGATQLPTFFNTIASYFLFIAALEILLRFLGVLFDAEN